MIIAVTSPLVATKVIITCKSNIRLCDFTFFFSDLTIGGDSDPGDQIDENNNRSVRRTRGKPNYKETSSFGDDIP